MKTRELILEHAIAHHENGCACSSNKNKHKYADENQHNQGHEHNHNQNHDRAQCRGHEHNQDHNHDHEKYHGHEHSHSEPDLSSDLSTDSSNASGQWLRIMDMDCTVEESQIRQALESIYGIKKLEFRISQRALHIDASNAALEQAIQAIKKLGFDPQPVTQTVDMAAACDSCDIGANFNPVNSKKQWLSMGAALALALIAEGMHFFLPETQLWTGISMAVAAIAIFLAGFSVYRKGLRALMQGTLNINALMTVAVTGAFIIGQWAEAAMVMSLYAIAEWLEGRSADKARQAVARLLSLAPDQAEVQQDGKWQFMPVADILVGSIFRVKAGERIALDGVIEKGFGAIDQSPVTGESVPIDKEVGDSVFAGTINTNGLLQIRSTTAAGNSTLARIISTVEQAQTNRPPVQSMIDKFASIYTPMVFVLACTVAVGGVFLFHWAWLDAIYKALVLLVIACPCALVLATPTTIVGALASAARRGILIKGGKYLEQANHLKAVAFDKTGTLTEGEPKLQEHVVLNAQDKNSLLVAYSLACASNHPVSVAIAEGLLSKLLQLSTISNLDQVQILAGKGIQASIDNRTYFLGSVAYAQENSYIDAELQQVLQDQQELGRTITLLADGTKVLAWFAVADAIKLQSANAISALKKLGVHSVVLSGDQTKTVQAIAKQAGIDDARGFLLPEEKMQAIIELQKQHGVTAMVGDGINDAPALSQSDLGFAMGSSGTDIAFESADVVVMNDDLNRVAETIHLSRHAYSVLWQNVALALFIKVAFLALTVTGHGTMWMAVFADVGASLLVIFNGLRLLRWKGV